jgi:hypothetical protein
MITSFDWVVCLVMTCIAIICFCQAYINLVKKRFTHFGVDALMVNINLKLAGKKRRKYVLIHMEDPERVRQQGVVSILIAIGFIWGLFKYWIVVIRPLLK